MNIKRKIQFSFPEKESGIFLECPKKGISLSLIKPKRTENHFIFFTHSDSCDPRAQAHKIPSKKTHRKPLHVLYIIADDFDVFFFAFTILPEKKQASFFYFLALLLKVAVIGLNCVFPNQRGQWWWFTFQLSSTIFCRCRFIRHLIVQYI